MSSVLEGRSGLAVLIDPGRASRAAAIELARSASGEGAALLLLGNSFGSDAGASDLALGMREVSGLPVIQFPATAAQLIPGVDALLLLSLVSGRNAQYLIEEHVRAVPFADRHPDIEIISTAYCLIDGGVVTSVESVSQTRPLPADKPELVSAHVRAAMMIGMRAAYLEAGSGAREPVKSALIRAARDAMSKPVSAPRASGTRSGPLFVGGGIRSPDGVRAAREAGADFVVVGTLLEQGGTRDVRALAAAASS